MSGQLWVDKSVMTSKRKKTKVETAAAKQARQGSRKKQLSQAFFDFRDPIGTF